MTDLDDLKALKSKVWTPYKVWCDWDQTTRTCHKVTRRLTSEERKLVYQAIVEHKLIVKLYTAGNQGVGMQLRQPCALLGVAPCPGIEFSMEDTTPIINLWEDHFFDDEPIEYRYRTWCRAHGTHQVDKAYQFFRAFADLPHNYPLMEAYNFRKPFIEGVNAFHY